MPEGPSIVILRETIAQFTHKKIINAEGNAKVDMCRIEGRRIKSIRSFGKQLLIELDDATIRIHLLMFGSYRVSERIDRAPRLRLTFAKGEINFYTCSVRLLDGSPTAQYDWRGDVMSEDWSPRLALQKLRRAPKTLVCDALLDQDIFAGVGNIIKNEVLFRIRVHPLTTVGALPTPKLREMVKQARDYSFEFLKWKKVFQLRKHLLAHQRKICPRDHVPFERGKLGKRDRNAFYCLLCQKKY